MSSHTLRPLCRRFAAAAIICGLVLVCGECRASPNTAFADFLRPLKNPNLHSHLGLAVRLVKVVVGKDADGYTVWRKDAGGSQGGAAQSNVWRVGDYLTVEVRNTGTDPGYVTVFDVDSDGKVKQAWPSPHHIADDNVIIPNGAWRKLWNGSDTASPALYRVVSPDGAEVFKALITSTPLKWVQALALNPRRETLDQAGDWNTASYTFTSLKWVQALALNPRRETLNQPGDWKAASYTFSILPKNSLEQLNTPPGPPTQPPASPQPHLSTLYVLCVGYSAGNTAPGDPSGADVSALSEVLQKNRGPLPFGAVDVRRLVGRDASLGAVERAFQEIAARATPADTVLFYYTGHTIQIDSREAPLLLMTAAPVDHDYATYKAGLEGISPLLLRRWLSRIQAQSQLVVVDAAAPERPFRSFVKTVLTDDAELAALSGRRLAVLGAVGQAPALRGTHRALTQALLEGLRGRAPSIQGDETSISAQELEAYLKGRLLALSQGSQRLSSDELGDDFSVGARPPASGASRAVDLVLASSESSPVYTRHGRDYALLFGTNEYDHFHGLKNPIHDVDAVAKELSEGYGFDTTVVHDATKAEMENAIKSFLQKKDFQDDDQLLIFFSGHGDYNEKLARGVVICKDTVPDDVMDDTDLTYDNLTRWVNGIGCKHIFLILDVCFGGTIGESLRSAHDAASPEPDIAPEDLIRIKMQQTARLYLTSGGKDYVPDGRGDHSPFAYRFLEALHEMDGRQGILRTSDILRYVETALPQPCYGTWGNNQPGSDFLFLTKSP